MIPILKQIAYIKDSEDTTPNPTSLVNFEVTYFASAKDALNNLEKSTPQLMLVDMTPEKGIIFIEDLQLLETFKNLPTIFLADKLQSNEIRSLLNKGVIGFISKPVDRVELSELINNYWQKYHAGK